MKRLVLVLAVLVTLVTYATPAEAHHRYGYSGSSYYRRSYPYAYGMPYGYGYSRYGNPANSFANPAAFGFGPGAIFGY